MLQGLSSRKRTATPTRNAIFLCLGLLGFGEEDYVSAPVAEALLDPQHPSDPPRRHMAVTGESLPLPLVRPHWMRILWGPPAMEITRGGELRVQVRCRVAGEGECVTPINGTLTRYIFFQHAESWK